MKCFHHLHKERPARRRGLTVKMLYRLTGAGEAGEAAERAGTEGGSFDLKTVSDKVHLLLVCSSHQGFVLLF